MSKLTENIETCLHCANTTYMQLLYDKTESEIHFEYDSQYNADIPVLTEFTTYKLLKCPACNNVSLQLIEACDADRNQSGEPNEYLTYLYPTVGNHNSSIPKEISNAFESALRIRNVDKIICVVALRRTLEIFCKKQGAVGNNLFNKVKDLVEKNIIPMHLDEASHIIRDLGNAAAHGDNVSFDDVTINGLIKFTKLILEYVYVIPHEILSIQKQNQKIYENK